MLSTESRSLNTIPATIQQRQGRPIISGFASVFDLLSQEMRAGSKVFREVVRPGAFLRSLVEAQSGRHDILARYEHLDVIGRTSNGTLRLRETAYGLHYEIQPADTSVGNDLIELLRRKDITGASFSFRVRPDGDAWAHDGKTVVRELRSVQLLDISPTSAPAYPAATASVWMPGQLGNMQRRLILAEKV